VGVFGSLSVWMRPDAASRCMDSPMPARVRWIASSSSVLRCIDSLISRKPLSFKSADRLSCLVTTVTNPWQLPLANGAMNDKILIK